MPHLYGDHLREAENRREAVGHARAADEARESGREGSHEEDLRLEAEHKREDEPPLRHGWPSDERRGRGVERRRGYHLEPLVEPILRDGNRHEDGHGRRE